VPPLGAEPILLSLPFEVRDRKNKISDCLSEGMKERVQDPETRGMLRDKIQMFLVD
jgi:hypothetical protein